MLLQQYLEKYGFTEKIHIYVTNRWEAYVKASTAPCEFVLGPKPKNFLCFNRILRSHRLALLGLLSAEGLVDQAFYSFFRARVTGKRLPNGGTEIIEGPAVLFQAMKILDGHVSVETFNIVDRAIRQTKLPKVLNISFNQNVNTLRAQDEWYFRSSYFSLVTETHFFPHIRNGQENLHEIVFTEKTFKPIGMKHPFVLVAPARSLRHLRALGYRTFEPYINESYDLIENHEARLLAVVAEVKRLCAQTPEEWATWENNIASIVEHNYDVLMSRTEYVLGRY